MAYEANHAGIGVGKTFGPRDIGDVNGVIRTEGAKNQVAFEVTGLTAGATYTYSLPADYLVLDEAYMEVETAFGGTMSLAIDGGIAVVLATTGAGTSAVDVSTLTNKTNTVDAVLTLTPAAGAISGGVGKARIVVQYVKI